MSHQSKYPPAPREMLLEAILADNKWTISHSPPDGHCLLHSTISSFTSQLPHLTPPTVSSLNADIRNHMDQHAAEYFTYYGFDAPGIRHQMHRYIKYRYYNSDFVDIAPLIIARLLRIRMEIFDTNKDFVTRYPIDPLRKSLFSHSIYGQHHSCAKESCRAAHLPDSPRPISIHVNLDRLDTSIPK